MRPSTRLVVLGRKLWTPAALGLLLALWLDANDSSTITLNGFTVSQWRDKSGNNRHASQSTVARQPTYITSGKRALSFNGTNSALSLANDLSILNAHSIFVAAENIATINAATTSQLLLSGGTYAGTGTNTSEFYLGAGSVTGNITNERLSGIVVAEPVPGQVYGYGKTDADVSGGFLLSNAFSASNNSFRGRLNGSNDFATASSAGGYTSNNTRYPSVIRGIGHRKELSSYWNGQIWEIIVVPDYLSLSDTELIEGYLAHKWDLTANLPNNHPFRFTPPFV